MCISVDEGVGIYKWVNGLRSINLVKGEYKCAIKCASVYAIELFVFFFIFYSLKR